MKTIGLILTLLASTPVFAGTCSEISGLVPQYPKIDFGPDFVSVDKVCVKGDQLYTVGPVEICVEWITDEAVFCGRFEKRSLSTPLHWSKEIAIGNDVFQVISGTHPLSYKVPVFQNGELYHPACEMDFTIPACH